MIKNVSFPEEKSGQSDKPLYLSFWENAPGLLDIVFTFER
jgi:hypothetical protein